ncbi:hypothetical protein S40288_00960 [Stachybotrys chartarum IBT 40288]|nr:hypothetical protein S40288_00960 [Stachybotrys chartarum IBT 40288]
MEDNTLSNSGYEMTKGHDATQAHLPEDREFMLQGQHVFLTYSRSMLIDKNNFVRLWRQLMEPHLPVVGRAGRTTYEYFGSRESHARKKLMVCLNPEEKGVEPVYDTQSVYIRKKNRREQTAKWLEDCQAYVVKGGDTFGELIDAKKTSTAEIMAIVARNLKSRGG